MAPPEILFVTVYVHSHDIVSEIKNYSTTFWEKNSVLYKKAK